MRQQLAKHLERLRVSQREQIYRARGGDLDETWQMRLALCERWPRLGIESDNAFAPDVGDRTLEIVRRCHQIHVAFKALDRQLGHFLPGNRADDSALRSGRG